MNYNKVPLGTVEKGNVNLKNRPVVKNRDGSISTVRSLTFTNDDGTAVLVPSISDDGKEMSDEQSLDNYRKTGKHLGVFRNEKYANRYARKLHRQQSKEYVNIGSNNK